MTRLPATAATRHAARLTALIVFVTTGFLFGHYAGLPELLPVHFKPTGLPDGWQYRTPLRVLLPVLVQLALAFTLGTVSGLLLTRPRVEENPDAADVKAATAAAEAVVLIALVWVLFQAYAAWALVSMWMRGRGGLGMLYAYFELTGIVLTGVIAVRANAQLGHPEPRPFVAEHWRYGQLYKNADDPALFVPTRDGRRWTLNFGRPVAAALLGVLLLVGIVAPTLILALFLRTR